MGRPSLKEYQVMGVLGVCLVLWMLIDDLGIPEAFVSLCGVAALLFMETISWDEVVRNDKAWDSFFWLSGMILMAEQLSFAGVTHWFGNLCAELLSSVESPVLAAVLLALLYFISMYFFSSLTGHIVAMVPPFMEAGKLLQTPRFLQTGLLAYFSALSGTLTNYSSGPTVIYFGQGLITKPRWFLIGLLVSFFYMAVYLSFGLAWWKYIGWF
ncbi:Sodium/sulfate symporter [Chytridium lagenaria]|nr:Sodium/sulfate symporter [Chytridium lagenaria]